MSYKHLEEIDPPIDEILAEVRTARAELLHKHGGLHGLVAYLCRLQGELPRDNVRMPPEVAPAAPL